MVIQRGLHQRLAELRDALLLALGDTGCVLTPIGHELIVAFEPLSRRALRWQREQA